MQERVDARMPVMHGLLYIYIYIYTHSIVYIYIYIYIVRPLCEDRISAPVFRDPRIDVYTYAYAYTVIYMFTYFYTYIYARTRIYTYMHTCIHTCMRMRMAGLGLATQLAPSSPPNRHDAESRVACTLSCTCNAQLLT